MSKLLICICWVSLVVELVLTMFDLGEVLSLNSKEFVEVHFFLIQSAFSRTLRHIEKMNFVERAPKKLNL